MVDKDKRAEAKEARSNIPAKSGTGTKGQKEARSNIPGKQGWRTVWWVLALTGWTALAVIGSQMLVGRLMVLILGGAVDLGRPIWTAVYEVLSYGLALWLTLYVPTRVSATWSLKLKTAKRSVRAKAEGWGLRLSREELGLNGTPTWTDIGLAPIGFVAGTLLAMGVTYVFSLMPWFDAGEAQNVGFSLYLSGWERGLAFLLLVVVAPVAEELIFRGWLYGKLRTRLAAPAAILVVSALFGLVHMQWNVGVNVFALSVVLCLMREVTGTVYAGILTHMIKNGVAFYLLFVLGMM